MGVVLNKLITPDVKSLEQLNPDDAAWLTTHADASGLAVVEVERLWKRFQQITESRDQKYMDVDRASREAFGNDIFVRNLLKHFPRSERDPDSIPFSHFMMVMKWMESSSLEKKLSAVYYYLNNGKPISAPMIAGLLKHAYPETNEENIKRLANEMIQQLGGDSRGEVDEDQFVKGVQRCISRSELDRLFQFEIIPTEIIRDMDDLRSPPSTSRPLDSVRDDGLITENQLRQIASRASTRNWQSLALKLGFLEYDIEAYKSKNLSDSQGALFEILETWYYQDPSPAQKKRLRIYLQQSGFEDLIPILN